MKTFILSIVLAAAVAAPALALPSMDGPLPMYPSAHLDPRESSVTTAALARGVPIVLLTADSVAIVDRWYKGHLPQGCNRIASAQGVQYKCSGGSVQIYDHGGTQIALLPPLAL